MKSKRRYGSPKITDELNDMGFPVGKNRVARRMKAAGLRSIVRRKYRATTDSKHSHPVADNLLQRNFTTDGPDKVWVSDISVLQQRRMELVSILREKLHERWRNRPSEVCLQGLASNRPQRHRLKALVVSVEGKGEINSSGMNREGEHP